MALGLGVLRLSPREFWTMTPREFDAAVRGALGPTATAQDGAPALADVLALMDLFPDEADLP